MPTVPTFAVRETDVSRLNGGSSGVLLKPLRDDSALRALSSLSGLRGALEVPPLCRETSVSRTANVGTVGKNGLNYIIYPPNRVPTQAPGMATPPVNREACTLERANCVSKYLGRNTMKPAWEYTGRINLTH